MEHIQPDGTKLSLFVTGDEYYRRVHDERDFTILLDPQTGFAVYAVPENGDIRPSQHIVGTVDPATLGIQPKLFSSNPNPERRYREQLALASQHRATPTGTINNIVCFVRFSDQTEFPTATPYSWYNNIFNSTTQQSLADFYDEVSSGQLDVNTYLYRNSGGNVLSVQVSHSRGYYSPYNATTNPGGYTTDAQATTREWSLMGELCGLVDPLVPNTIDLDTDDDGVNDALTFIIRGGVDDWADILWPAHVWWSGAVGTINGIDIWHYVKNFEGALGASVICHEMGHMIGFPDLYRYDNDWIEPVGQWSLMAHDNAQHELAYEKWKYGTWFSTIPTITPSSTPTQYTLTAIDQSPYSCFKIASSNPDQFYMLEYRRDTGRYESGIPASGLIVYRVIDNYGGSDVHGNAGAPPDEIYVYRPGGDIDTNGNWVNANFSSTVGRTAIHNYTDPEPWLYVNATTQVDGNLVITDVGASGGTSITFTVRNSAPNIWDGSSSTNWETASNWSQNSVPTNAQYVEIPGGMPSYPNIPSTTPTCNNSLNTYGATVTIGSGTLNVIQDVDNSVTIAINNAAGNLYVGDDLFFQSGSTANVTAAGEFWIGGDLELLDGCNVNMANGYVDFSGTSTSFIRCYEASAINHLRSHKTGSYLAISGASTASLTINGNFWTYDGSTSYCYDSEPLIVKGGILCYDTGVLQYTAGTVSMEGTSSGSIYFEGPGSYFNNLRINKTGTSVLLSTDVDINGSLTISSGYFNPGNHTVNLAGNWTNSVGPAAFSEGTSTVILDGGSTQTMTNDDFFILELNKSGGIMSIPTGVTVTCSTYNWTAGAYTVSGGTFTVADLEDPGIFGTITLTGGTINYSQDASNYVDLRANLTISGGTFNVYGGNSNCWFSYVDVATLTMSNGVLDIHDQGIWISSGTAFNDNISGGSIRTSKNFSNNRPDFNPSGGTIVLYGSTDAALVNDAGINFHHVYIDKSSSRTQDALALAEFEIDKDGNRTPITRSNTITGSGPIDINGIFTIQAGTFVAPDEMTVAGNWVNAVGPTAFNEGTGTVIFDGSGHQYCNYTENFNNLIINKSGGALRVNNSGAVVSCVSYEWIAGAVDVLVGNFTANDLAQSGIYGNFYVNPGATINLIQDSAQWIDLNGFFYLTGGGTINVFGGLGACFFAYSAPAGITMSGGEVNIHSSSGISITTRPHALTMNITGGFLRTAGFYYETRGGVVFNSGTVVLNGPGVHTVQQGTGSSFYNLAIEKAGTRGAALPSEPVSYEDHGRIVTQDWRENSITADSNLQINGSLTVGQGVFILNDATVTVNNDLAIWSTLRMNNTAGFLNVWDDVLWQPTSVSNVSAGTIYCGGNWYFTSSCTVDLTGSLVRMNASYGGNIENNSTTARFGDLEIFGTEEEPEFDYVAASTANLLLVQGNLRIYGENTLNMNSKSGTITGTVQIDQTGGLVIGGSGVFTISGDLLLYGNLSTGTGTLDLNGNFTNTANGFLSIGGGIFRCDAPWADPWVVTLNCGININTGTFQVTYRTLSILAHASRIFNNASLSVGMGFVATQANCYQPSGGYLNMIGTGNPVLQVSGTNFIPSLNVSKAALANTVYLQNDTIVTGNVTLASGKLNTNNFNMIVGGNWSTTAGTADFAGGSSTVTFNKAGGLQSISGTNNFFNVIDNHTGAALDFQGPTGISGVLSVSGIVTFQNSANIGTMNNAGGIVAFYGSFTSTITNYNGGGALRSYSGSHVNIADLVQNGLYGSFIADSGHLEFHQDGSNWIDLNGPVTIANNGIIDIYGGSMSCYIAYDGDVNFTMSSGSFNVKTYGIVIPNNTHSCSFNISGGTISINTSFSDIRGNFNPTGGTLKFEGTGDASLQIPNTSNLYNLLINKAITREAQEPLIETDRDGNQTRIDRARNLNIYCASIHGGIEVQAANIVTIATPCTMTGAGDILVTEGEFRVNGTTLTTGGNINVIDRISLYPGSTLALANNKSISILSGGLFKSYATEANPSLVTRNGATGNYVFNVESGGTIGADYTTFEYISIYGLNVKTGALVDPAHALSYCTFRNGPIASKLLTVNNTQDLVIDHANFPVLGTTNSYNASKTVNGGTLTFTDFTGDFSGTEYEWDPYERITWDYGTVPEISNLQISQGLNNITLSWSYGFPYDHFNIYACGTPDGTFVLAGTTTNLYWTGSSSLSRAFYKVTVVQP